MSLIEGFGNDFLFVLTILLIIFIAVICWISTYVPDPFHSFGPSLSLIHNHTLRILSGDVQLQQQQLQQEQPRLQQHSDEEELECSDESSTTTNEDRERRELCNNNEQNLTSNSQTLAKRKSQEDDGEEKNKSTGAANETSRKDLTSHSDSSSLEFINVCFRFLNETQKKARVRPDQTVAEVRSAYFAEELAGNKLVRFIYHGRFLPDSETLRSCNVTDNTIVHCHILEKKDANLSNVSDVVNTANLDLSWLLCPMIGIMLFVAWVFRFNFRNLFSPSSTLMLAAFSLFYATIVIVMFSNLHHSFSSTERV